MSAKIIVRPRQSGKTTELVKWVLEGNPTDTYPFWDRVLLVGSIYNADAIRREWTELEYRQVFSWEEWRTSRIGRHPVQIAVDNADMLVAQYFLQSPDVMTLTGEIE